VRTLFLASSDRSGWLLLIVIERIEQGGEEVVKRQSFGMIARAIGIPELSDN